MADYRLTMVDLILMDPALIHHYYYFSTVTQQTWGVMNNWISPITNNIDGFCACHQANKFMEHLPATNMFGCRKQAPTSQKWLACWWLVVVVSWLTSCFFTTEPRPPSLYYKQEIPTTAAGNSIRFALRNRSRHKFHCRDGHPLDLGVETGAARRASLGKWSWTVTVGILPLLWYRFNPTIGPV